MWQNGSFTSCKKSYYIFYALAACFSKDHTNRKQTLLNRTELICSHRNTSTPFKEPLLTSFIKEVTNNYRGALYFNENSLFDSKLTLAIRY